MNWQQALAEFKDGPDEGWLELRRDGDHLGFAPFAIPSPEELERLYVEGWRINRPN